MERKIFVDVIKGVAIILVVMQHIGGNLNSGIRLLCKIDVPLFFICSGFLSYKNKINIRKQLKKNLKRLVSPFILAVVAASIFYQEGILEILMSSGKRGYWFLEALFLMFLLFWIIYRSSKMLVIGGILIECLLLFLSKYSPEFVDNIMGISYLSRYFPCFLAGAIIRKHHIEDISQYGGGIKAALLLVLLIGLGYNFKTTNISFLAHVVGYLAASILAFFFIGHYEGSIPNGIRRSLAYFGRYSLNIYIIHFFIVPYISTPSSWFIVNFILVLLLSIIVSAMSIAIGKILTYSTPLNKVLTP